MSSLTSAPNEIFGKTGLPFPVSQDEDFGFAGIEYFMEGNAETPLVSIEKDSDVFRELVEKNRKRKRRAGDV